MTKEYIRGIVYLCSYIRDEHFANFSKMTRTQYRQISEETEELEEKLSTSSIERVFSFLNKPSNIKPETLDKLTFWCFQGEGYHSFLDFINKNEEIINKEILLPDVEFIRILKSLTSKKQAVVLSNSRKDLSLGGLTLQLDLSEGYVSKLLDAIKPIVGDLVSKEIQKIQSPTSQFKEPRVNTRLVLKESRRQKNIEQITAKAIEFAQAKESTLDSVDIDWVTNFFEESQDCSDEKMQYLWAKILADEVDMPGSFSRRAVNAIKLLDSDEAGIFALLCNCLWEIYPGETRSDRILFSNINTEGYYSDSTWGFDGTLLRHIEDLGLIHESYFKMENGTAYNIAYFGKSHQLSTQEEFTEIDIFRLSTVGNEIYNVVRASENEAYYQHTLEFMKKEGILKS